MTRRRLTDLQRAKVFLDADGTCHICTEKIKLHERWEVEHVIPLSMGGEDEFNNMRPAHQSCHREKTANDKGNLSKAKSVEARAIGAHLPKQRINPRVMRNSDRSVKEKLSSEAIWARKNARNAGDEQ